MGTSQKAQEQLGWYCKTGVGEPQTSIQENTFHYRRLVINIGYDTILRAFPLAKGLLGLEKMNQAVEHFYANHSAQTPQVWKLPYEFYEFYLSNAFPFEHSYPFLSELLLFEWLEIEVFMMPDEEIPSYKTDVDIEEDVIVLNPEIIVQPLAYPLHKKNAAQITEADKGQYLVSMHRDVHTKQVQFNELSLPMVLFLEMAQEKPELQLNDLVEIVMNFTQNKNEAVNYSKELIEFGLKSGVILGAKK